MIVEPNRRSASATSLLHTRTILAASLLCLALLGCGAPPPPPARVLVLDLKVEQSDGLRTISAASLLLDGKVVAHFEQPHPESAVVFSRRIDGTAPGDHLAEVRIDKQTTSPNVYAAGGYATYEGRPRELMGTGGTLATGQAFRFPFKL
jgi:hypothetical protein